MDPYRVFFPLGTLAAILGTLPWVSFSFGWSTTYPSLLHADLMIGGFVFAFSAGFLMTAIPQFTGSSRCKGWELGSSALLFLGIIAAGFLGNRAVFHFLSGSALLFLVIYCARRFLSRSYEPPRFFVFVGLGLLMGIAGSAMLVLSECGVVSAGAWGALAKLIYTQGMVLSLILGVGTHLLPAIWGWTDLPVQITKIGSRTNPWRDVGPVMGLAAVLGVSFVIESHWNPTLAWALRAGLVTFLSVSRWKILRKPKARGKLAFWLWISAWALVVGLWLPVISPAFWIHGMHVAFIGGFGLMTFMVASRVTLAHGGYGHRVELRSKLLTLSCILILFSALTRAFAPLMPQSYAHHLGYAAVIWILAVVFWGLEFLPKMIRIQEDS